MLYAYVLRSPRPARVRFSTAAEHAENAVWVPLEHPSGQDFLTRLIAAAALHFDDPTYWGMVNAKGDLFLSHR